ncbi:MAG TPA: DUF5996 family protein [Rhodothermales bacterium]
MPRTNDAWPSLPLDSWEDTFATLHRWTQIVGKIRLAQTPWINHSWHVPLYVCARGMTTSAIPHGDRSFELTFDFLEHRLLIQTSEGHRETLPLRPQSVAEFYAALLGKLDELGFGVSIHGRPNELEDTTPFAEDREHAAYDAESVTRLWRILVQADRVFQRFRARFIGKCSPVQFFWGSFDLAVTRFSGRTAPKHPGAVPNLPDWVVREAYSHEVSSLGFWPGGGPVRFPMFYSYAYPEPEGFADAAVSPEGAFYSRDLREWVLPYDVVRESDSPDDALLAFAESTYRAAADLGHWDRQALERPDLPGPRQ